MTITVESLRSGSCPGWTDGDSSTAGFVRAVGQVARDKGLVEPGYRMMANIGAHGGQEVPHLHVHIFGGEPLGPMIARR